MQTPVSIQSRLVHTVLPSLRLAPEEPEHGLVCPRIAAEFKAESASLQSGLFPSPGVLGLEAHVKLQSLLAEVQTRSPTLSPSACSLGVCGVGGRWQE